MDESASIESAFIGGEPPGSLRKLVDSGYERRFVLPSYPQLTDDETNRQDSAEGDDESPVAVRLPREQSSFEQFEREIGSPVPSENVMASDCWPEIADACEEPLQPEAGETSDTDGDRIDASTFVAHWRAGSAGEQPTKAINRAHNTDHWKTDRRKADLSRSDLRQAIDSASVAANSDIPSLRTELQRERQASDPNPEAPQDNKDIAPGFAEAVKKLDDAATKLDKALSKAKGVQLLSD
jgi:hypothetical protein